MALNHSSKKCEQDFYESLREELLSIDGIQYPVFGSANNFFAEDWNLNETKISYSNGYATSFSTMKPDGLIETTYSYPDLY